MRQHPIRTAFLMLVMVVSLGLISDSARASLVIQGTRVVYSEEERDVSVSIKNPDPTPFLMQAWLAGSDTASVADADAPFILSPAMSRIDPNKAQQVRIVALPNDLPADRESVFYLHVLGIPPKVDEEGMNHINVAVRSVVKMFYRPAGLKGDAISAHQSLAWTLVKDGSGYALSAHNPTPFHVSFANFRVTTDGKDKKQIGGGMVAPGATEVFHLEQLRDVLGKSNASIYYTTVDDWGAMREFPLHH